jgi:hypothetical protein
MLEKHESIPLIDKPEEKKAEENGGEELVEKSSVEKSSVKECVTDLDALVEKWIDFMYETTNVPEKAKCFSSFFSGSRSKREPELKDYDVEIDWTNVNFEQEETLFDSDKVIIGNNTSQTLLQTSFVNRTSQDQESSFKMERTTTQVCEFSFDKGFKSTQKPGFTLLIPQDIAQVDASIKRERSLVAGQNVVAKEEVTWKCDSVIKVKPNSTTFGSLVITEMEMDRTFKGVVWIEGMFSCHICRFKAEVFVYILYISF